MEAAICLIIAMGFFYSSTLLLQNNENLNDVILFQYGQDAAEVCARQYDFSIDCIKDAVREANKNLIVDETNCGGKAKITRIYGNISFCVVESLR